MIVFKKTILKMKNIIRGFVLFSFLIIGCSKSDDFNSGAYSYKSKIGSSAFDILSNENFPDLTIEVLYVEGFKPQTETLNNLENFIKERTYKSTVKIDLRQISITKKDTYEMDDIRTIEDDHKLLFTEGNQLVITALFLNGKSSSDKDNSVILGTAYRNTSFVIFEETIQYSTNMFFGSGRKILETSVILHEFCHLLGLVNVGSEMIDNHQDKDNGYHCINQDCLMYYQEENQFTYSNWQNKAQVPQLDAFCLADLRANGGK